MEGRCQQQLIDTVQFYFDRRELKEKADFKFSVLGAGRLQVELHTKELLVYLDLAFIEKLVFALMPIGIMYELVNVANGGAEINYNEYKALPGVDRVIPDINTSDYLTMPISKKKNK